MRNVIECRPSPVIIDTDPGVDDALALLLAGASPELDVLAVTTVGGNVPVATATQNARRILPVAWRDGPPLLAAGLDGTLTAEHVHGPDGLGGASALADERGIARYPPLAAVSDGSAVEVILSLTRERPGEITLIALGPLSNAAAACFTDPAGLRRLRQLVVMGGAFRGKGNVTSAAEFNVYADPEAARVVLGSGIPQIWVPLDVTEQCRLGPADLVALPETPRARLARAVTEFTFRFHESRYGKRGCFLHDPLAVGAVLWPELLRAVPARISVDTGPGAPRGNTAADFGPRARPANAEICLEVDAATFLHRFLERMAAE